VWNSELLPVAIAPSNREAKLLPVFITINL
jgi:hypothetical protein